VRRQSTTIRYKGEDVFGPFKITGGPCSVCGDTGILTVGYLTTPRLPLGIPIGGTILKDEGNYLGINCGDYARFHRQVAHITDKMNSRQ